MPKCRCYGRSRRKTHIPIATGERLFTKWGFREVLEKGASSILQPDLSHAGGIFEGRTIAGMAEAYYAGIRYPSQSATSFDPQLIIDIVHRANSTAWLKHFGLSEVLCG